MLFLIVATWASALHSTEPIILEALTIQFKAPRMGAVAWLRGFFILALANVLKRCDTFNISTFSACLSGLTWVLVSFLNQSKDLLCYISSFHCIFVFLAWILASLARSQILFLLFIHVFCNSFLVWASDPSFGLSIEGIVWAYLAGLVHDVITKLWGLMVVTTVSIAHLRSIWRNCTIKFL